MSCCGESRTDAEKRDQQGQQQQQAQYNAWNQANAPITQQPGMQPQPSFSQYPNQFGNPAGTPNQFGYPNASMNGYPQQPPTPSMHQQQASGGANNAWPNQTGSQFGVQQPAAAHVNPAPTPPGQTHGSGTYTPLLDPNIVRPSPVHMQDARTNTTSPTLSGSGTSGWQSGPGPGVAMASTIAQPMSPDEGKLSISIDFGTTFSGVAYGSSRIASGKVQQILHWPGSFETFRKIPTCLLYDEHGR
ncbi:123_t:CDS:2, partial [Acaulospora colombiana]